MIVSIIISLKCMLDSVTKTHQPHKSFNVRDNAIWENMKKSRLCQSKQDRVLKHFDTKTAKSCRDSSINVICKISPYYSGTAQISLLLIVQINWVRANNSFPAFNRNINIFHIACEIWNKARFFSFVKTSLYEVPLFHTILQCN